MTKTTLLRSIVAIITLHALWTSSVTAQCRPPKGSNEAKLLAFYSIAPVFSADPMTLTVGNGLLRLSGEGAYVPTAPAKIQHTEECYTGRVQHTALTQFFGRPRLALALPHGLGAEVSYLPPVKVSEATPNLFSAAVWLTRPVTSRVQMTARAHMTRGTVHGPITCPDDVLQQTDAQGVCYGERASDDEFRPNMTGGELLAAMSPWGPSARVQLHAGIGVNFLRPRFQVDFVDLLGGHDRTQIAVDLTRITGVAGATFRLSRRCHLAAQGFTSFSDGATIRGLAGCALLE